MNPFGDGSNGALNVLSGTVVLNPNQKYQYTSIFVASGATLTVPTSSTGTVLYLLSQGSVIIEGTINLSGRTLRGQFTRSTTIDSITFNYPSVANGGSGGAQGVTVATQGAGFGGGGSGGRVFSASGVPTISAVAGRGSSGSASFGVRGVGGSITTTVPSLLIQNSGSNATVGSAGGGGQSWAYYTRTADRVISVSANAGNGATSYGGNGSNGGGSWSSVSGSGTATFYWHGGGGGGGGGNAGQSGINLYIKAPVIEVTGTINTSGTSGGNGGNGGIASVSAGSGSNGSGAGGGGGGNAGTVRLVYSTSIDSSGTITRSGGSAGSRGTGLINGSSGSSGSSGSLITTQAVPYAEFSGTPLSGTRPFTVTFTNNSIGATSYLWDFGDSTTSTDTNPTHEYSTTGTFTVTLTATNSAGSNVRTRTSYITSTIQTFQRQAKGTLLLSGGANRTLQAFRSAGGTLVLSGQANGFILTDPTAIEEKTYLYKVYDPEGNYIEVWKDVISDPVYTHEINEVGSVMNVELARNSDSVGVSVEDIQAEDGTTITTESSIPLQATVSSRNQVGPGSSVNHNNRVDVFVFYGSIDSLQTESGQEITTEDGEVIMAVLGAPNGLRIFTGFISEINSRYGSTETTQVQLMSYGFDLSQYAIEDDGDTRITYNSQDPSFIVRDAIDKFMAQSAGDFTYTTRTANSILNTSTTVSYTFNVNNYQEVLKKCLELMPPNWYFRVGLGDNIVYYRERSVTPKHKFFLGKHIKTLELKSYIGDVVNDVLFVGGGDPALYRRTSEAKASRVRKGLSIVSDSRVTIDNSADIISEGIIEEKNKIQYRSTIEILDKQYDIESINVGDMVGFRNFGNYVDELVLQVVALTYTPDFVQLQLDSKAPSINKRLADIQRNLNTIESVNTPDAPV